MMLQEKVIEMRLFGMAFSYSTYLLYFFYRNYKTELIKEL